MTHGPLHGLRIIEIAGLGPTPFAAMTLADMGAEVLRIERPGAPQLIPQEVDILNRGRGFVTLDLKSPADNATARALISQADALIEGMRPGTMERLGLGPEDMLAANPRLVYGRMTGWGQHGPRAQTAGHDINYISLTGMLHAIGSADAPAIPLNLLGDFGGGGLYLAFGMVCALLEAQRSGEGQIVDAAITDGVSHMAAMIHSLYQSKQWTDKRQSNLLDGAAPFYTTYQCACGDHVAVGAIEGKFWAALLTLLDVTEMPPQMSRRDWPGMRARLAATFASQTRAHWVQHFAGTDACVTPVLSIKEALRDPHLTARATFTKHGPEAAPRLSRTPGAAKAAQGETRLDPAEILGRWSS
ncbi:MAG: CaiB/BaiF CoA-transferase family protein [Paracoccaceae bacterium]